MDNKPVYILGDIHYLDLIKPKLKEFDVRDCYIICVGDLGVGFVAASDPNKEKRIHADLNKWFAARGIIFYGIRGNHDDPAFFNGPTQVNLSNFKLLPDYTLLTLNGERFLCVGGAISVDRIHRKVGVSYWTDEALVFKPESIQECDVLITHTAPTWIGPLDKNNLDNFSDWKNFDKTLWDECLAERKTVNKLIELSHAKMHYCGHFHHYSWVEFNGVYSTILAILQMKEHRLLV
jgi:UDP-2,3-diacylglucosamine pyrophosphatase LpxH